MAWYDIKLDDDSPQWRAYQEEARRNNEHLLALIGKTSLGCAEPSAEYVRFLRDRFERAKRRPPPTQKEIDAYWNYVRNRDR